MKLDSGRPNFAVQTFRENLDRSNVKQQDHANTWVKLRKLPNPYSFDEALLLCQVSEDEWLAWIPDHGQAVIYCHEFR